ncbi:MAG: hypothetical protein ACM3S1_11215 [Hyphomicrobiales bacterium]
MPDRGLLAVADITAAELPAAPDSWKLTGARWAQLTYEVNQAAALSAMPGDVTRPIPCYARLFVLEAADSPAGPLKLATLMTGGRYRMMPRNVLVDGIVDGPAERVARAFGSPYRAGTVSIERDGQRLVARIGDESGQLAELVLPGLYAIDPGMLRWDGWLGFGSANGQAQLVEYGPRPDPSEAFLSKGASLETNSALARTHPWRKFRNINTISACYVEGDLVLSAPEVQQALA